MVFFLYKMEEKEIKELNRSYNIVSKKNLTKDIEDVEYKFLYMEITKYKKFLKNYFDLRYLKEFFQIIKENCINYKKNNKKILIETNGEKSNYKNIDFLKYNNLKLYKVMDGFYTSEEEKEYIKNNFNKPFWFSSWFYALLNLPGRAGGITCFQSNKRSNILIINCKNIKELIKIVRENENEDIKYRGSKKTKKYTIEILKLASCSDKGFMDQVEIFSKLNNYGKDLWFNTRFKSSKYSFCELEDLKRNDNYFALTKSKGKLNYDFAYLLAYLNKKYYNNYFDGYIINTQYTPYETKIGIIPEEIVIFNPYKNFKRFSKDKYDWQTYKNKIKFTIPIGLRLQNFLSDYNKDLKLFDMYHKKIDSVYNINLSKKFINNFKIIFINCNKFKSINYNYTLKEIYNDYNKIIDIFKPEILVITNIKNNTKINFKNYKSYTKNNTYYFYKSDKLNIKIFNINSNIYSKYLNYQRFKKEKKEDIDNLIKKLKNTSEDILYFNSGLINIKSKNIIDLMEDFGYKNYHLKNSFYLSDNFLFIRNIKVIGNYLLDFNKSYYYPQLVVIKNN